MEQISTSSELEKKILDWFSRHYPDLKQQIQSASIIKREYSGVGFFIYFNVDKNIKDFQNISANSQRINGPSILSDEIPQGGDSVLFFKDGYMDMLEFFSYGDSFPKNIKAFTLKKPQV